MKPGVPELSTGRFESGLPAYAVRSIVIQLPSSRIAAWRQELGEYVATAVPAASITFRPMVVPPLPPDIRKFRNGRPAATVNSGEVSSLAAIDSSDQGASYARQTKGANAWRS